MVGHAQCRHRRQRIRRRQPRRRDPGLARQRELRHAHLGQLLLSELRFGNRERDRLRPECHGQPLPGWRLGKGLRRVREQLRRRGGPEQLGRFQRSRQPLREPGSHLRQPVRGQLAGHRHLAGRRPLLRELGRGLARTTPRTARAASRTALPRPRAGSTTSPTRATAPTAGLPPWRNRPPRAVRRSWSPGPKRSHDQIGFGDPVSTRTADRTDVATFTGSGTINARTTGFPSSGELRVGTSAAWADGGGSYTGAILSYTGTTSTSFTGVSLVRGSGTLAGPIREVQPYKVTAETCYANDCALTVSPPLATRRRPVPRSATPAPASSTPRARRSPPALSLPTAPPTGTAASGRRRTSP